MLHSFLDDLVFKTIQSAASPPLAAPAATWKAMIANTSTSANTAVAEDAQSHIGSPSPVFSIHPLEINIGSQLTPFALLKTVVAKVSVEEL